MSQLKPTPERPLRRQTSSLRAAASHGQGLGSGSGAGLWLSGSSASGDDEETEAEAGQNGGGGGDGQRTYQFPAAVVAGGAQAPDSGVSFLAGQAPSGGQLSITDKVDLDLSFDYVSRLEGATRRSAGGAAAAAADASSISSAGEAGSESSSTSPVVERPSNPTPSRSGFAPLPNTGTPTPLPGKASLGIPSLTEHMATPAASSSPPRGMATASWSARRKLPPAPLSFLRPGASKKKEKAKQLQQQQQQQEEQLTSYFSPVTPSPPPGFESEDEEEILPVTPISASKRGADSGLNLTRVASNASSGRASFQSSHSPRIPPTLPPTEPLPALPTDVDVAALVKQQRLQAQALQRTGSPAPSLNSSFGLPPPAISPSKRSVPLGFAYDGDENVAPASSSDIIEHPTTPGARVTLAAFESENDFRQYLRQQQLQHIELSSPPTGVASNVARSTSVSKNGRPVKVPRESTASLESFMTARTAGTSSQNHARNPDGQQFQAASDEPMPLLPSTNAGNMLGLNLDGNAAAAEAHEELQDEQHDVLQQSLAAALRRSKGPTAALVSPGLSDSELDGSAKSSPGTPFSALFSEPDTARTTGGASDYTAPSELGTPSAGTFSKLFGFAAASKRRSSATDAMLAAPTSTAMTKAASAPGAEMRSAATGLSLIQEADSRGPSPETTDGAYGERQRTTSGMPRSETAEWIRAHSSTAAASSDSACSEAEVRAPVVLSTHTSDDGEEVFRPRGASFAVSDTAAAGIRAAMPRRMSDVRGPWPQSPLLLSTSPAGPVPSLPLSPADKYARAMEGLTRPASVPLTKDAFAPSTALGDAEHGMGLGVGLGLNFGEQSTTKQPAPVSLRRPDHTEVDMRGDSAPADNDLVVAHVNLDDLAVDREVLPAKLLVPQVKAVQQLRNSPSVASSIEGFACNVTPPVHGLGLPEVGSGNDEDAVLQLPERAKVAQADELHRNSALSVLSSGGVQGESSRPASKAHSSAASGWGALAGLRWGTKFFSIASTASLGVAHRPDSDVDTLQRPTPMRSLTLVDKRGVQSSRGEAIAQRRASYSHRRSHSREDLSTIVKQFSQANDSVRGIASAPASAVLPDAAVFSTPMEQSEPTMPDSAHVSTKRQKRNSRIRYLSNGNEIRLDMGDDPAVAPQASLSTLDDLKSPRVGASPSGWTPRLHFGPSWAGPSGAPASSEGHGEGPTSYTSHRLSDPNADAMSPRSPGSPWLGFESGNEDLQASRDRLQLLTSQTMPGATLPHQYFSDVSEGIRQRNSVMQRPAHRPASSLPPTASVVPYGWASGANKRSSGSARVLFHDADRPGTVIDVEDTRRSEAAHTRSHSHGRPMSIFVPTSAIEAHLLRSAGVNTTLGHSRRRSSWFGPGPSAITSTVEQVQPSKSLFYAGFMGMPWLWLIGGWYLSDDGLLVTPANKVAFWAHEASMREAAERDAAAAQALGTAFGHEAEASAADTFWSGLDPDDSVQMERNIRTLLDNPGDLSTNGTTRTLRTVKSRATLESHFSAGSREAGSPEQIPTSRTRTIASAFSANPEVALFRSPVREAQRSPEQDDEPSVRELAQRHSSAGALNAVLGHDSNARGHRRSSYNYRGGNDAALYGDVKSQPRSLTNRAVGIKARCQAHLHHWYRLDGYVVLNRVAAIIAGLLVLAGFSAAMAVVVASF